MNYENDKNEFSDVTSQASDKNDSNFEINDIIIE